MIASYFIRFFVNLKELINSILKKKILMTARLVFFMILAFFIALTAGCSEDSSDSVEPNQWVNRCFTIVDSQTGSPVEGAFLHITYNYSYAAATAYSGISDINGLVCGEIRSDARPYWFNISKENYQMICNSNSVFPPEIINMDYESYLKFKIKNEEPYTAQDRIIVAYKNLDCFGLNEVRLNGINVDTTLIRAYSPNSSSWISVESAGANPFKEQFQVNVNSRDTAVVNIIY